MGISGEVRRKSMIELATAAEGVRTTRPEFSWVYGRGLDGFMEDGWVWPVG